MKKGKLVASQHQGNHRRCKQRGLNAHEDNSDATDAWKKSPGWSVGKSRSLEHGWHLGTCGSCAPLHVAEAGFSNASVTASVTAGYHHDSPAATHLGLVLERTNK